MHESVVLLPTYNERENIAPILNEIFTAHPQMHVLVIDDNSPDGTADIVRSLMAQYPNLALLLREKKEGLGVAYRDGLRHVLARKAVDRIILMDADGSHDVRYLADMLRESEKHDLIVGSRYIPGGAIENWEPWRFALSKYGNLYAWILTGLPIRDLTSGFQCFRGEVIRRMNLEDIQSSGYAFQIDLKYNLVHLGARVKEIPIVFKVRRGGESKISRHIIREGLLVPMRLLFKRLFHV